MGSAADIVPRIARRAGRLALVGALLALQAHGPHAEAAELVLFERPGCVWCRAWDREVGGIYPKTDEGRRAPLRRVMLDRSTAAVPGLAEPVIYSPTFVIVENGREIGRIVGYPGEAAFWGLMTGVMGRLPPASPAEERAP